MQAHIVRCSATKLNCLADDSLPLGELERLRYDERLVPVAVGFASVAQLEEVSTVLVIRVQQLQQQQPLLSQVLCRVQVWINMSYVQ